MAAENKTITMDQLKEHKNHENLWLLIQGKVYDVSKFMDEHPGGDDVLLSEAGKDATEAFEDVGHSDDARALLGPMLVGEIEGGAVETKSKTQIRSNVDNDQSSSPILMFIPLLLLGVYLAYKHVS